MSSVGTVKMRDDSMGKRNHDKRGLALGAEMLVPRETWFSSRSTETTVVLGADTRFSTVSQSKRQCWSALQPSSPMELPVRSRADRREPRARAFEMAVAP